MFRGLRLLGKPADSMKERLIESVVLLNSSGSFKPFPHSRRTTTMLYVGIDQHTRQLTLSIRNEDGDVVLRRTVGTKPEKVRGF